MLSRRIMCLAQWSRRSLKRHARRTSDMSFFVSGLRIPLCGTNFVAAELLRDRWNACEIGGTPARWEERPRIQLNAFVFWRNRVDGDATTFSSRGTLVSSTCRPFFPADPLREDRATDPSDSSGL